MEEISQSACTHAHTDTHENIRRKEEKRVMDERRRYNMWLIGVLEEKKREKEKGCK